MVYAVVVGIGGASRSGKTTLVEKLHREYLSPVQIISLDQFYKVNRVLLNFSIIEGRRSTL
jgi:uridine kinase